MKYTLMALGAAAAVSAFLYAAFGVMWWTPMDRYDMGRQMTLAMMHAICMVCGFFAAVVHFRSKS